MNKALRDLNEALPGMLLVDLVYLVIGEIIILLWIPDTSRCAVGFLAGVAYSVFASFQMSLKIRKAVYGHENPRKAYFVGYSIRLIVMIAVFAAMYLLDIGNLLCVLIGMFSMKVAAYVQPFADKLLKNLRKER